MRRLFLLTLTLGFIASSSSAAVPPGGGGSKNPPSPSSGTKAADGTDHKTEGIVIRLDDFGSADIAYLSIPDQPPIGGVVIAHDGWGLNWGVSNLADRLADVGYIVLVPDFFSGQTTTDPVRAAELLRDVTPDTAAKTLGAAVRFLKESPRFRAGRVAVVGLGAGGAMALPVADVKAATKAAGGNDVRLAALALLGGKFTFDPDTVARIDKKPDLFAYYGAAATPEARAAFAALLKDQKRTAETAEFPQGSEPTAAQPLSADAFPRLDAFLRQTFAAPEKKSAVIGVIDSINPFHDKDADAPTPKASPAQPSDSGTTATPATP